MYTYALSVSSTYAEDPAFIEAVKKSKVKKFEFCPSGSVPPEQYATAVSNILKYHDESGIEAASIHIPFGVTPWVPSRAAERKEALAAVRGLMKAWSPLRPARYTMHGCTEADIDVPRKDQIRDCRDFLSEIMPDLEEAKTSFNIEYLPRTCIGNVPEELEEIVDGFPADRIGICLDVNHASPRTEIMPQLIRRLGPRINTFHISDTDGVDECHWFPGYGIIDWPACMKEIKALTRDVLLVLEVNKIIFPEWQKNHHNNHSSDLAAMEANVFFLENAEEMTRRRAAFVLP